MGSDDIANPLLRSLVIAALRGDTSLQLLDTHGKI